MADGSSRSHVSSYSFLSRWPFLLIRRPSNPQVSAPDQEGRNDATPDWRSTGLGTISPWTNAVPTIVLSDLSALSYQSRKDLTSPSETRHPESTPSMSTPMPERNTGEDAFDHVQGEKGTCGPDLGVITYSDDVTTTSSKTELLESRLDDSHHTLEQRRQGTAGQTSLGNPTNSFFQVDMTQEEDTLPRTVPLNGRLLRKSRPKSFAGEPIPLSTFLAQRSLLGLDENMALVLSPPAAPNIDVIPALTVNIRSHIFHPERINDPNEQSTSLSRNPSSSTYASFQAGPPTEDSHLQTPFEPAIVDTSPSFGQLWDLMDQAKAYPFSLPCRISESPDRGNAKRERGQEIKEGAESKERFLKQIRQNNPLDKFNDFGQDSSRHTPLSTLTPPLSLGMAAVATLGPALSLSKLPISAHSSDTDLSTSSYFTARPFPTSRPSSTETNTQGRRSSGSRIKSASSDNVVYHAITHDDGDGSPGKQRTTHRPARRRETPPSAFRRAEVPLPPTHLPYHGPFDTYVTDPDSAIASLSASRDMSGSPMSWIVLSPHSMLHLELTNLGRATSASTLSSMSRTNSLSLRAAPQPPRRIRGLTGPLNGQRSKSASPRVEILADGRAETIERILRPPMLPRSDSFKRVFRRWSNRSSQLEDAPPIPRRNDSDPHLKSTSDLTKPRSDTGVSAPPIAFPPLDSTAKASSSATSHSNRLKKQRSVDDSKSKSTTTKVGGKPLPRAATFQRPPRPPPPRSSSIPILIAPLPASLSLTRKAVISWAPTPQAKALPGIAESSSSANRTIVINDDISAEFGRGSAVLSKSERYRRCQSLVDIRDDHLFKQMVEDLPAFDTMYEHSRYVSESTANSSIGNVDSVVRVEGDTERPIDQDVTAENVDEAGEGAILMTRSRSLPGKGEARAKRDHVSAWFVTREIVQGEKRYGRLLAKGVAVLESLVRQAPSAPSSFGHVSSLSSPSRATFAPDHSPETDPLDILSNRLPQLLTLSLSLSALFDSSPSPSGISRAFVSREAVLVEQLGAWASEVGALLANGLSDVLDVSISALSTPGVSRSASFGNVEEFEQDERLSFADIMMMPVQRALRYKLLFQDLSSKVPPLTQVHTLVISALSTADKVAEECNARQTVDVSAFRRHPTWSSTKSNSTYGDSPSKFKPDQRIKRRSMGRDRVKRSHSRGASVSSTKTVKDEALGIIAALPTGSFGKSSGTGRPNAKRRISAGPMGLNTLDSPTKKYRPPWSLV